MKLYFSEYDIPEIQKMPVDEARRLIRDCWWANPLCGTAGPAILIAGVLMSYGPIQELYFPRAVLMADKALRGANVALMPIEGPDRFELVINMATARAIGLKIPASLLLRADEVIQ